MLLLALFKVSLGGTPDLGCPKLAWMLWPCIQLVFCCLPFTVVRPWSRLASALKILGSTLLPLCTLDIIETIRHPSLINGFLTCASLTSAPVLSKLFAVQATPTKAPAAKAPALPAKNVLLAVSIADGS